MPRSWLLLVDDEPLALELLCAQLEQAYDVITARTAETALQAALTWAPVAVITDHRMERRDGLWLLRQLATLRPTTRRILVSGAPPANLPALRARGTVDAFFHKPLDILALRRCLRSPHDRT